MKVLLDERSRPPLRAVIGALLASAEEADIAVSRVRIAALDLHSDEVAHVRRCRFLLGRLDAHALGVGPLSAASGDRRERVAALLRFLRSGNIEVRSAGMCAWTPDFSIFRGLRGGGDITAACLIGAHYFYEPPEDGPSFTWAVADAAAVQRATVRFEEMWERSHDALPAVLHAIEQFSLGVA
jgi:hypothetical protein